jgi:hypothetical protein
VRAEPEVQAEPADPEAVAAREAGAQLIEPSSLVAGWFPALAVAVLS